LSADCKLSMEVFSGLIREFKTVAAGFSLRKRSIESQQMTVQTDETVKNSILRQTHRLSDSLTLTKLPGCGIVT